MIYRLRQCSCLTQSEFATQTGTSQPAVAQYESGKKSPTERTVLRMGDALGLEMHTRWVPTLTREDRRSLAYHEAVVTRILEEPEAVIGQARQNATRWLESRPHAQELLSRWMIWLDLPVDDLSILMLDPCLHTRDMRQLSPFAGLLSASERTRILKQFQRERAA